MGNYQTIFTENCPQIEAEKMLVVEDFSVSADLFSSRQLFLHIYVMRYF